MRPLHVYWRLVIVLSLAFIVLLIIHLSGLRDLLYRRSAPVYLSTLPHELATMARFARFNPFVQLDRARAWLMGEEVFLIVIAAKPENFSLPPNFSSDSSSGPVLLVVVKMLSKWIASPDPLNYVPDPEVRAVRYREVSYLSAVLLSYFWSTQRGAVIFFAYSALFSFLFLFRFRPRSRPRGVGPDASKLDDLPPYGEPPAFSLARGKASSSFLASLAEVVVNALPACGTAQEILRILDAYRAWPASLGHHDASAGGLVKHTLKALVRARTHLGAQDLRLGRAFLLAVFTHDVGKVLTYAPHPSGRFVATAIYHANRSADILTSIPCFHSEFSSPIAEAIITTLRCSAGRSMTPIPLNAPEETTALSTWLSEVDKETVKEDVANFEGALKKADIAPVLPKLLNSPGSPASSLPPPLYIAQSGGQEGTPYLLREPAVEVLLRLLSLDTHPGAQATVGRRNPAWEGLREAVREAGLSSGEDMEVEVPGYSKPFRAILLLPEALARIKEGRV